MGKAFTKETDEEDDDHEAADARPVGAKNYITRRGLRRLQEELRNLKRVERPKVVETVSWAAGNGDRSENGDYIYGKKRLRGIDRRMRFSRQAAGDCRSGRSGAARRDRDKVFFGATVTYANGAGEEKTIRIVGVDKPISSGAR